MSRRLAFKFLFIGGKRALSRQVLIAVSVAIGTMMLLTGLAAVNLYNQYMSRDRWDYSYAANAQRFDEQEGRSPNLAAAFQTDFYRGQAIEVVHVAPLTDQAEIRGVPEIPRPNQYYASPQLAKLLDSEPKDQLSDRYAGLNEAGIISAEQLDSPKQLVLIVGHDRQGLPSYAETLNISKFYPRSYGSDLGGEVEPTITRLFILLAISGFLLPVLILIGSSTRIASQRREENLAALRLVGATTRQTKLLTALDALLGAGLGSLVGLAAFELLRRVGLGPRAAGLSFNYVDLNIPPLLKLLVVMAVPLAAIVIGLLALRRVNISPLGVSRKIKQSRPRAWRSVVLLLGAALFVGSALGLDYADQYGDILSILLLAGFVLTMIGLVIAGPWLLLKFGQLLSRISGSASLLIAARRMQYDPKSGFRAVAGVVMVVFFGAWTSGASPAMFSAQTDTEPGNLRNVLPILLHQTALGAEKDGSLQLPENDISPERSAEIERGLARLGNFDLIKIYSPKPVVPSKSGEGLRNRSNRDMTGIISCTDLAELDKFGSCTSEQNYKQIGFVGAAIDHAFGPDQTRRLRVEPTDISRHYLHGYMIRANDRQSLEKIRTYFVAQVPESIADYEIKTFGEDLDAAKSTVNNLRAGFNALVGFVLVVGLMSMAISAVGSILERKRSYTMLRLAGADTNDLSKTVFYEALLPLVVFTLFSGALGYGSALLLGSTIEPPSGFQPPSGGFLLILLGGYAVGAIIVWLTLPLLKRVSNPTEVRYE